MDARYLREWNYLRREFSLSFAAFDELDYRPIDVLLDSLAGPICESAQADHHFLVERAHRESGNAKLSNIVRPLVLGGVHAAVLHWFWAVCKQILLSSLGVPPAMRQSLRLGGRLFDRAFFRLNREPAQRSHPNHNQRARGVTFSRADKLLPGGSNPQG